MKRERCVCKARGDSTAPPAAGTRASGAGSARGAAPGPGTGGTAGTGHRWDRHRGHRRDPAGSSAVTGVPHTPFAHGLRSGDASALPQTLPVRPRDAGSIFIAIAPAFILMAPASPPASSSSPVPPQQLHPHLPSLPSSIPSAAFIPTSPASLYLHPHHPHVPLPSSPSALPPSLHPHPSASPPLPVPGPAGPPQSPLAVKMVQCPQVPPKEPQCWGHLPPFPCSGSEEPTLCPSLSLAKMSVFKAKSEYLQ